MRSRSGGPEGGITFDPGSHVTIDINRINAEFWAAHEEPREARTTHPGITDLVREAHLIEIRAIHESHDRQRAKRTAAASAERQDKGDATRFIVLDTAERLSARHRPIFMTRLAELVADELPDLSFEHVLRILKEDGGKNKWGRSSMRSLVPEKSI
jgi:hypothetical protein